MIHFIYRGGDYMSKMIKWILIIVVGLFSLVLIIPFMIGFLSAFNPKAAVKKAENVSNQQKLAQIDDNAYTFYYPSNYTKSAPQNDEMYFYENLNTSAVEPENIALKVENIKQKPSKPTYEFCSKYSETYRTKAEDEIKAEVVTGGLGGGKGIGCKVIVNTPIEGVNDSIMMVEKALWDTENNDNNIYRSIAIYFSNASENESGALNMAVDGLTLK